MNKDVIQLRRPADPVPEALITGTSAKEAADILFGLLLDVVRRHQPEIEPILKGGGNISGFTPELMSRALQAQGLWFQLLSIAEQNAAMRRRRNIENTRGRENLQRHVRACAVRGARRTMSAPARSRSCSRLYASAR